MKKKPKAEANSIQNKKSYGPKDLAEFVSKGVEERIQTMSELAMKAGDVLKFILDGIRSAERDLEFFRSKFGIKACSDACKGINVSCGRRSFEDITDTDMIKMLFAKSKYKIDPGEMVVIRTPDADTKDAIAVKCIAKCDNVDAGPDMKANVREAFSLLLTKNMKESVDMFDKCLDGMKLLHYEKKCAGECKAKCDGKCCKAKPIAMKPKVKPAKAVNFVDTPPKLKEFKDFLLKYSKYDIPSSRFQILADRVDRKSQKYVYELRFYQKSYKSVPADKRSYETSVLRVRMNGDRTERILDRFDKAVGELKFNSFQARK